MIFEGVARRFFPTKGGKAPLDARLTHLESLAMGLVEPADYEMTRAGRRFSLSYNGTVPTGIAPVQAFPTTAAQWAFSNGDAAKTYAFKTLGALLFSGTQGLGGKLLICFFQTPAQIGLATGITVASHSFSAIGSKMAIKSAVTITAPTVPNWLPIAEDLGAAARVGPVGSIINRSLFGKVLLPPGVSMGLAVLAPAGTTPLYLPEAEWLEVESDLE